MTSVTDVGLHSTPDFFLLEQPEWEQDHMELERRLGLRRSKGWGS